MDEHENINFEHELSEKFKALDKNIKIPETPDANEIFEHAEKETAVVPFSKIKKYSAIAAAVVLICVSIPIILGATGGIAMDMAANEAAEEPMMMNEKITADSYDAEPAEAFVEESVEEPAAAPEENNSDGAEHEVIPETDSAASSSVAGGEQKNAFHYKYSVSAALEEYFETYSDTENPPTGGDDVSSVAVKSFEIDLNKKRRIDVEIEKDSVSVMLFDETAESEIISAFWVEGTFVTSGEKDGFYVVELFKNITKEDFENDCWLPMAGDAEKGTYFIDESFVEVNEKINSGRMNIKVKLDIGTGEYEITAKIY